MFKAQSLSEMKCTSVKELQWNVYDKTWLLMPHLRKTNLNIKIIYKNTYSYFFKEVKIQPLFKFMCRVVLIIRLSTNIYDILSLIILIKINTNKHNKTLEVLITFLFSLDGRVENRFLYMLIKLRKKHWVSINIWISYYYNNNNNSYWKNTTSYPD